MKVNNANEAKKAAINYLRNGGGVTEINKLDFQHIHFIDGHWHLLIVYRSKPGTVLSKTLRYHMEIHPKNAEVIAFYK